MSRPKNLHKSLRSVNVQQLALDFNLEEIQGYASIEVDGRKSFSKITDGVEEKKLFKAKVNGNILYRWAKRKNKALVSFRYFAFKEWGIFNITDLHMKTDKGWSRVSFTAEEAYGKSKV